MVNLGAGASGRNLNVQAAITAVAGAVPAAHGVGFGGILHSFELGHCVYSFNVSDSF